MLALMAVERLEPAMLFRHPLAAAVVSVVGRIGYRQATVEDIVAAAGVEMTEFDRLFADKDDAVLQVYEAYMENFKGVVGEAFASEPSWPDNLRAAAYVTARWFEEKPFGSQFGMVEGLAAGEMVRLRREEIFLWSARLIEAGRAAAPDPEAVPQGAALMAIGAVVELFTRQAQGTFDADPIEIVPKMMYQAVLPYLGEEAARRELAIPPPPDLLRESPDPS